jgi:hypothetical protein
MNKIIAGLVGVLLCGQAAAATGRAAAAFATLRDLQGKWTIQSGAKTLNIQMTYDTGSKGSIVTEQFGKELSVFYRNGNELLMTHFCNAGNQPRLRLREDTPPGTLEFDMFDITNLADPADAHVQKAIYRRVNENQFELELVWHHPATEDSEKYTLTRAPNPK